MPNFGVMCSVSGGVTGSRGPLELKEDGKVKEFPTFAAAEAEALRLQRERNGNPHRTADFRYWAVNNA